jgi:hypothetical protein
MPAFAVLGGLGASYLVTAAATLPRLVFASSMVGIQIISTPPGFYAFPRPNNSRIASEYIKANSAPTAGVLAETVAIEFYSGRPVRFIPAGFSRKLVLASLAGETSDDIVFVVMNDRTSSRLQPVEKELAQFLSQDFELVFTVADTRVFRRKHPTIRGDGRPG